MIDPIQPRSPLGLSRRHFLWQSGGGLGAIALAWLMNRDAKGAELEAPALLSKPGVPFRAPHFAPRAKRVVQVFCMGGVSQIDTFDFKPGSSASRAT